MKRAIPTVKAEALEKGKFELTFLTYATYRNPHQPGVSTMVEVAPIPNGSLFRFSTFLEDEDGSEIVGVNYKTIYGIHPCDSPLDERRVFLYKGDMDKLIAGGDAEYLDMPERPKKEEVEAAEEMLNKEIEAKLADLSDEDDSEPEDNSTEESDEGFDTDGDKEEAEDDDEGGFDFDETQEDDDENESSDDDTAGAVDVSDMSPEQIRDMLNNHYHNDDDEPEEEAEQPEPEPEKVEEPKKEEPEKESKPNGSFIGAPADLSSHKEPYKGKKESKYDKKRDWENKNRDNRKNDKRDKKDKKFDKKKARREAIAEAGDIDFAAIARGAFE